MISWQCCRGRIGPPFARTYFGHHASLVIGSATGPKTALQPPTWRSRNEQACTFEGGGQRRDETAHIDRAKKNRGWQRRPRGAASRGEWKSACICLPAGVSKRMTGSGSRWLKGARNCLELADAVRVAALDDLALQHGRRIQCGRAAAIRSSRWGLNGSSLQGRGVHDR